MEPLNVTFVSGGNSESYTMAGWSRPEPHGTWTDGPEAVLKLPCPKGASSFAVSMNAGPCIAPPKILNQELVVLANGTELKRIRMTGGGQIEFRVPPDAIAPDGTLELRFRSPDSFSHAALGLSSDDRRLGFSFWNLMLHPLPDVATAALPLPALAASERLKVAVVTMVYNEREYLPIWLRYYAHHVGAEHCYVVDHGSTDGSTDALAPASVMRIPRSAYDPHKQSKWNSEFCSSLLNWYDWVLYCDVDELVMPDPRTSPTLRDYCSLKLPDSVTAIGLNVIHRVGKEPDLDLGALITAQRPYVFFASSMCKPLLTRRHVTWSPGSHSSDAPVAFDKLYAFHLRWFDLSFGLRRLQFQRSMAWARLDAGDHARVEDGRLIALYQGFSDLICMDNIDFSPDAEPIRSKIAEVLASTHGRENSLYKIDLDIWPTHLWRMPQRFIGAF